MSEKTEDRAASSTGARSRPLFLRMFSAPAPASDGTGNVTTAGEVVPYERPGSRLRASSRAARRAWYAPAITGAPSTTRQARVLSTALLAAPTGHRGIVNGRDRLSRVAVAHDSVTAYNSIPRLITSPNTLILGDVGGAKSSLAMTVFGLRALTLENRRGVVFDKKDKNGEGECAAMGRAFGVEPLRFAQDGSGVRMNLFDADILRGAQSLDTSGRARVLPLDVGAVRLLDTICTLSRGTGLDEWEDAAARVAVQALFAAHEGGRVPTPADLLPLLGSAADAAGRDGLSAAARERLHQAGLTVRWVLEALLSQYGALLDGDTSSSVDLSRKLTVFDVSQLPDDGPAVPVVMAMGHEWLKGRIKRDPGPRTHVTYEEGWHMVQGPTARLVQSSQKLCRALGIANTFVMHKVNDIPPGSPGMAVIQEAQTVYVYAMKKPEDARAVVRTFGMAESTAERIEHLAVGHCILKIGGQPEFEMEHVRSDLEMVVTDSDSALRGDGRHRE